MNMSMNVRTTFKMRPYVYGGHVGSSLTHIHARFSMVSSSSSSSSAAAAARCRAHRMTSTSMQATSRLEGVTNDFTSDNDGGDFSPYHDEDGLGSVLPRRSLVLRIASIASALAAAPLAAQAAEDRTFFACWPPFYDPICGIGTRTTVRNELVPNKIWDFTQAQTIGPISATIRSVAVKLNDGSVWLQNPVAPTEEFFKLLDEIGPVKHIVISTYAIEHKAYAADVHKKYPSAKVYVTPKQKTVPLDLPLPLLGIPVDGILDEGETLVDGTKAPWANELDCAILAYDNKEAGAVPIVEAAFFHKQSKSLIVTDAVERIQRQPPTDIVRTDLLLGLAPDIPGGPPAEDTPENRLRGWAKMCLLVQFFQPSKSSPSKEGSTFELEWRDGYLEDFDNLAETTFVAPIVRYLVYSKNPSAVIDWVDRITTRYDFEQVIPAHYTAPIPINREEFSRCFDFLREGKTPPPLPDADTKLLRDGNEFLSKNGQPDLPLARSA